MALGYCFAEAFLWHDNGSFVLWESANLNTRLQPFTHVENPESKRRLHSLVHVSGLANVLIAFPPRPATDEEILRVHSQRYLEHVLHPDTVDAGEAAPIGPGSESISRLAAGGVLAAVERVMSGELRGAYVLSRPPGHHAEPDQGRGFCIYSNVALGVAHALARYNLTRIAVVDFDVHHGNGTEKAFYDDSRVLFMSVHQDGLYPPRPSGLASCRGTDVALDATINVPLPPGCGDAAYKCVFESIFLPALDKFAPQMIFVSAGYDACAFDPLGRMMLPSSTYHWMGTQLQAMADKHCQGRVIAAHEGGYSAEYVPLCGHAFIRGLLTPQEQAACEPTKDPFNDEILEYPGQDTIPPSILQHHLFGVEKAENGCTLHRTQQSD